jgi:phosphatidate cytidylyltransferase
MLMITFPSTTLLWLLGALLAALVAGSVARFASLRNSDETLRRKRLASLRTWWILAIVWGGCLLLGHLGICLLLTVASIVAFYEYAGLLGIRESQRPAVLAAYAIAVINYLLILFNQAAAFVVFVPLGALAIVSVVQILQGQAKDYIRITSGIFWGMMTLFYGMGHAAYLFIHPAFAGGPAGPAGWFLYLMILTESNDIFQALVGRSIGADKRHLITPTLSPNKTWQGFFGGLLATLALAILLAHWLTTLNHIKEPLLLGLVVAIAGFFGDINMSGIKRNSGVKDGSHLLPGMGGLVDRIDSLTFTAPAFVYLLGAWSV